jgi:hydroxymethylglutaryl-CoA synthase
MGDIGITSYGIHIPRYRLSRKTLSAAMGWAGGGGAQGDKAVANFDEDSLSMAVSAGRGCLKAVKQAKPDGLYFASTTPPYKEKGSAAIMATALDFSSNIRTGDFTDTLKAGTSALLAAADAIKSGNASNILVCAADCRLSKPAGALETVLGDGGAAFTVSNQNVAATIDSSYAVSYDFPDYRRTDDDKYVRSIEDRFIREEGYLKFIAEAVNGLLKKSKLEAKDIAKVAYPCLNVREHANVGKKIGLQPVQIQEPLMAAIGEAGAASSLMLLVAMLDEAKPGDKLIVASYGNGSEAILLTVTGEITKLQKGILKAALAYKKDLTSYERYLAFRGIIPVETSFPPDIANTQLVLNWRERKTILGLYGSVCKKCGTPQYPAQRICVNPDCRATDEMEEMPFADKTGKVFTYTADYASPSLDAPLLFGIIDFDGGGRMVFEFTDTEFESIKIGTPVKMVFRRKYYDAGRGIVGYFWKVTPIK